MYLDLKIINKILLSIREAGYKIIPVRNVSKCQEPNGSNKWIIE
jgi:hypothetical protein